MKFTLEIDTNNEEFVDNPYWAVYRALLVVAGAVESHCKGNVIRDINGNTVGSYDLRVS